MLIETKRLIIREFQTDDLPHIINMNAPEEIRRYIRGGKKLTEEEEKELLLKKIADYKNEPKLGFWAICLKANSQLIGSINLVPLSGDEQHNGKIHLGYRIAVQYWRNGYALEATSSIIDYAQKVMQLSKISAFVDPLNISSLQLLTKHKFKLKKETEVFGYTALELELNF